MERLLTPQIQVTNGRRTLKTLYEAWTAIAQVRTDFLGPFDVHGQIYTLPRFTFGDGRTNDAIRLGIFAGIHGDELAGALAAGEFLSRLSASPELAQGFLVHVYPVCNPTGFEDNTRNSRRGRDLNREFWHGSTEPEVCLLEQELRTRHFHGLIQLHTDDTSDGVYGYVRGHTLTENLLRPALREAGKILPRNNHATIDGFAARDSIIYKHYEGILAAPAEIEPAPFEIIFETPQLAPLDLQVRALLLALETIMTEYRLLIAYAQNI